MNSVKTTKHPLPAPSASWPQSLEKCQDFITFLMANRVGTVCIAGGRLFHKAGATMENACFQSPKVICPNIMKVSKGDNQHLEFNPEA